MLKLLAVAVPLPEALTVLVANAVKLTDDVETEDGLLDKLPDVETLVLKVAAPLAVTLALPDGVGDGIMHVSFRITLFPESAKYTSSYGYDAVAGATAKPRGPRRSAIVPIPSAKPGVPPAFVAPETVVTFKSSNPTRRMRPGLCSATKSERPSGATATFVGSSKPALVPMPSMSTATPLPATVVVTPPGVEMRRMRKFGTRSATYTAEPSGIAPQPQIPLKRATEPVAST